MPRVASRERKMMLKCQGGLERVGEFQAVTASERGRSVGGVPIDPQSGEEIEQSGREQVLRRVEPGKHLGPSDDRYGDPVAVAIEELGGLRQPGQVVDEDDRVDQKGHF